MSYLPAICSEDWSRRPVPLHCFLSYLWRAAGSEPHSSLCEYVLRRVDIPIDGDATLRAEEGAPPIRVRSRPTYRAVHTRSSRCHVGDRYSFPPGLVFYLFLELVVTPRVEPRSVLVALSIFFSVEPAHSSDIFNYYPEPPLLRSHDYRGGDVVEEPAYSVSLNRSVLSVDASPDSRVVSLEVPLRLPASGFNLGRPAEVVAQDASVRVRRCHVVEVAVDSNCSDGLNFCNLF